MRQDLKLFEKVFEYALEDRIEVAVLGAAGLYRLGNPQGKNWFLRRIDRTTNPSWPGTTVIRGIDDSRINEVVLSLKEWLSYAGADQAEFEIRAMQTEVAIALAKLGSAEGISYLREILAQYESNAFGYTGKAALCLAETGNVDSLPEIRRALATEVVVDKLQVAEALLMLGSGAPVPALLAWLKSEEYPAWQSADLLIKYRVRSSIPTLETALQQEFEKRAYLRKMLSQRPWRRTRTRRGQAGLDEVVDAAYRARFHIRVQLAVGLIELASQRGKDGILALLRNPDDASRDGESWERLCRAVVQHKIVEAAPHLVSLLDAKDPLRRSDAVRCLQGLTGVRLPAERKKWESWFAAQRHGVKRGSQE